MIFLNLRRFGAFPRRKKKEKEKNQKNNKKYVTPSTYKYVRNTLNLLNKGGGTARTRGDAA